MSPLSPASAAHPVHAGVSEPVHPALCLCPGCHLLRHARVPRGPLTSGCRMLLHPEVLPSGIQVTAAFLVWRGEVWGQGQEVLYGGGLGPSPEPSS